MSKEPTKWFKDQCKKFAGGGTPKHLKNATDLTKYGQVNMKKKRKTT